MKNFTINKNPDFYKDNSELIDNESFSLKSTDSLYKKDIGKFIEFLTSYFL